MYVGGCTIELWAFYKSILCLQEWPGGLLGSDKKLSMVPLATAVLWKEERVARLYFLLWLNYCDWFSKSCRGIEKIKEPCSAVN